MFHGMVRFRRFRFEPDAIQLLNRIRNPPWSCVGAGAHTDILQPLPTTEAARCLDVGSEAVIQSRRGDFRFGLGDRGGFGTWLSLQSDGCGGARFVESGACILVPIGKLPRITA